MRNPSANFRSHLLGGPLGRIIQGQENSVHGDRRQDYSVEPRVRHQLKRDLVDPSVAHGLSIRLSQLAIRGSVLCRTDLTFCRMRALACLLSPPASLSNHAPLAAKHKACSSYMRARRTMHEIRHVFRPIVAAIAIALHTDWSGGYVVRSHVRKRADSCVYGLFRMSRA